MAESFLSDRVGAGVEVPVSFHDPLPVTTYGSNGNQANTAPGTGTQTSVVAANAQTVILAANGARAGATIFNDSTAVLYLLLAAGSASNTNYSVQIPAGGYYEVPFQYEGAINGFWSAVNGNARVTELT